MRTVGTFKRIGKQWELDAEAHVMLRAKRVFAQVAKKQAGKLRLTDTTHVARDMEWFFERYPCTGSDADAKYLAKRAREHDEAMAAVQNVFARDHVPPTFELAVPARVYQRSAAELTLTTSRLLLADDVGLGKTATAICVISDQRARPAVVVTLTHLPRQWREELRKFAPGLQVMIPKKGTPTDRELSLMRGLIPPDVIVLSYSKLAGWAQTLVETFRAKSVVFDEIQELRTGTGSNKGSAGQLLAHACEYRMGLSATPIYGYGGEIFNIVELLDPGALGSRTEFETEWCSHAGAGNTAKIKEPKAFGTFMREHGLMLRRTGKDVRDEVPELALPIRIPHQIDSDTRALDDMKSSAAELARIILSNTASGKERMQASGELDWRLRQATGIAKAPFVATFVRMLLEADEEERVLLYGWHHAVYSVWGEALKEFKPVFYTGDESIPEKERSKEAFLKGDARVLIMSLRAGAGLDGLQSKCRIVVFGELDWSPGVHDQCIGRVHRPGQDDTVCAYFLHSDEGTDPTMVEVLGLKKAQIQGIRDPDASIVENVAGAGDHMKRLAEQCLQRAGEKVPEREEQVA